jgi:hypothetical protein
MRLVQVARKEKVGAALQEGLHRALGLVDDLRVVVILGDVEGVVRHHDFHHAVVQGAHPASHALDLAAVDAAILQHEGARRVHAHHGDFFVDVFRLEVARDDALVLAERANRR